MDRKSWLNIIACSDAQSLIEHWQHCTIDVEMTWLREPETGLLPLQARMGNTGDAFLFGDATVTRAVVEIGNKRGYAFVCGRNKEHARCAAIIDALMQNPTHQQQLITEVLTPLNKVNSEREAAQANDVAATAVDFFTMVRGE